MSHALPEPGDQREAGDTWWRGRLMAIAERTTFSVGKPRGIEIVPTTDLHNACQVSTGDPEDHPHVYGWDGRFRPTTPTHTQGDRIVGIS